MKIFFNHLFYFLFLCFILFRDYLCFIFSVYYFFFGSCGAVDIFLYFIIVFAFFYRQDLFLCFQLFFLLYLLFYLFLLLFQLNLDLITFYFFITYLLQNFPELSSVFYSSFTIISFRLFNCLSSKFFLFEIFFFGFVQYIGSASCFASLASFLTAIF